MKKRVLAVFLAVVALCAFLIVPVGAVVTAEPNYGNAEMIYKNQVLDSIDLEFYETFPFFNMFNPVYYLDKSGDYDGAKLSISENGVIEITGTVSKPSEGNKSYYDIVLFDVSSNITSGIKLPYANVTFSTNIVEQRAYMQVFLSNGTKVDAGSNAVTFNGSGVYITKLILRLRYDTNSDFMTIKPTLNYGSIAYGFVPYSQTEKVALYGFNETYQGVMGQGFSEGVAEGYKDGLEVGNQQGYDHGYDAGSQDGYAVGVEAGYNNGYNDGYSLGFDVGVNQELSDNVINVIDTVVTAPVKSVKTMLDFEIFGINISHFVFRSITLLIVLLVIGLFFKFIF